MTIWGKLRKALPLSAAGLAMLALVLCPEAAADAARAGLRLCGEVLVPSLLPFFVVSALLRAWGLPGVLGRLLEPVTARLWAMDGGGVSAFLMGVLGGYPLGAATVAQLRADGAISRKDGERALSFCNNSGPAFLLGAAAMGVFHSRRAGLLLYGAHVLSAVLIGMVTAPRRRLETPRERTYIAAASVAEAMPAAVRTAVDALLSVCGFVVLFSVVTGLLDAVGYLPALAGKLSAATGLELHAARALFTGLLEIGSGLGAMEGLAPTPQNLALCAFLMGFGGLSVHCQTAAVLAGTDLRGKRHFFGKVLQGVLSALMVLLAA